MRDPTYAVIDVETTMKCPVGENKANPFWPENSIVMRGVKRGDQEHCSLTHAASHKCDFTPGPDVQLLVGHNIGFDIHHMQVNGKFNEGFLGTVNLWDTQLAEYLLTAQRTTYASLDELVEKYGGKKKDSRVTNLFKAGTGADAIDKDMLSDYLKGDLENTELVFFKQFEEAQKQKLIPLITTQMDALAATIEMTYNGLAVDRAALTSGAVMMRRWRDKLEAKIVSAADATFDFPGFNPSSPKQVSTLLFGGELKWKKKEQVGVTKTGKPVFRNVQKSRRLVRAATPITETLNGHGAYPTDDKALNEVLKQLVGPAVYTMVEDILRLRDLDKQLGTYWEGLLKLVMPDGRIHHKLNHTVTRTGRLSSSEPNLQNVTNGDIKKVFVSRWGDDGLIVEADFKQLEMVELAIVSGDAQLIDDIARGVDMHDALFYEMHGRGMRPDERKAFKRCSFCLVYGGGKKAVAEQGGISEAEAAKFINTFYTRYEGVKEYHDELIEWAKNNRMYNGLKDAETGLPVGEVVWQSDTGRRYWFREYPTEWGTINFSPSELKNYMVQGGATGDKVPLCIGKLYRVLKNHPTLKDKCLLINTVHDSVMFDVHKDVFADAVALIKKTMERTPEFYEKAFGYKMPLPLKVEISAGPNWLDQTEVDTSSSLIRKAA